MKSLPDDIDSDFRVYAPRNGSERAIEEMNSKMLLFHPSLRRDTHDSLELRNACYAQISDDVSVSELFRRIIHS